LGGSVQWTPVGGAPSSAKATKTRRARASAQRSANRPGWQQAVFDFVRPGNRIPIATWTIAVVTIGLWIVGFITNNVPLVYLAPSIATPEWIWTYFTAAFVYPALGAAQIILGFLLNIVFLLLIAPGIERTLSRPRFLTVFFAGGGVGSALMVIAGSGNYGLSASLFGLFGAFVVMVWSSPAIRNQILIVLAINLVFTIVLSPGYLPAIIGGLGGGVGASLLFRHFDSRSRSAAQTPYLLTFGGVAVLIVIAVVRGLVAGL
jgi:membrane associated rhomboid family serine protease